MKRRGFDLVLARFDPAIGSGLFSSVSDSAPPPVSGTIPRNQGEIEREIDAEEQTLP